MKTYVCKKLRLMVYLKKNGFFFYKTAQDKYDPKRVVWLYVDSDDLQKAVAKYYEYVNAHFSSNK